jgi:predicted DNA-binding protein (UPF0251 family)
MGRQEKNRTVKSPPKNFKFRPVVEKSNNLSNEPVVVMRLDEFEAIRLADKNGYEHAKAAEVMGISRPTFTKLLNRARGKVAELIVDGKQLEISGGSILFSEDVYCCTICKRPFKHNGKGPILCPVCSSVNIIRAKSACNGDCKCCEEDE